MQAAGFVVTSGGIKRCWFPCLKSEMTNQFDDVFELTDMTFQLRWALMKKASFLTYFANMSIYFFFKWKNQVLTNINWLFRLVVCTASNNLRLVIANVLIVWMRSLNWALYWSIITVFSNQLIVHSQYIWLNEVETNQPIDTSGIFSSNCFDLAPSHQSGWLMLGNLVRHQLCYVWWNACK